jgi:hypothetical protein
MCGTDATTNIEVYKGLEYIPLTCFKTATEVPLTSFFLAEPATHSNIKNLRV